MKLTTRIVLVAALAAIALVGSVFVTMPSSFPPPPSSSSSPPPPSSPTTPAVEQQQQREARLVAHKSHHHRNRTTMVYHRQRRSRSAKLLDIRSPVWSQGPAAAIANTDTLFPDVEALCSAPPGYVGCSSRSRRLLLLTAKKHQDRRAQEQHHDSADNSSVADQMLQADNRPDGVAAGCCCSWTPVSRSCNSGVFNKNNTGMMRRLVQAHFAHTPTSRFVPNISLAAKACPVFDSGRWSLPDDFLDLNFHQAAEAAVLAAGSSTTTTTTTTATVVEAPSSSSSPPPSPPRRELVEMEKKFRKNIGPLLVWKLGRKLRSLKEAKSQQQPQKNKTTSILSSPGLLVIAGDSHVRQIFARLIHAVRSRECSDSNEMFRGGVFERYFHIHAGYIVTSRGDHLLLDDAGCERVAKSPGMFRGGRVLFRACYVWDNTVDAAGSASKGTEHVLESIIYAAHNPVSAIIFWPTMHHCNYHGHGMEKCPNWAASTGALLRLVQAAGPSKYRIPRVVAATTIMRSWYPFYQTDLIGERNEKLRQLLPDDMWAAVKPHLDPLILEWWRRRRNDGGRRHGSDQEEAIERRLYTAHRRHLSNITSKQKQQQQTDVRLYDFANRHIDIGGRLCDHGHHMCMFWPLRESATQRRAVNGLSGVCPNGSRCEDPWNFLILHELLALLFA